MKQIFFDDQRQRDLEHKGYAMVPLLERDEAAQLIPEIDELLRGRDAAADGPASLPNHVSALGSDTDCPLKEQLSCRPHPRTAGAGDTESEPNYYRTGISEPLR